MLKTLTAALIAASVLIAPMSVSANAAQPSTKTAIATKPVKLVKHAKRHVVRHHNRITVAKHLRHHTRHGLLARHGKLVKAHKHAHVVSVKPRVRAN